MMTRELSNLWSQLGNKVLVRELLEPFMTWGLVIGIPAFMLSLWMLKDRRAQILSLILIVLACASVYPVVQWRPKNPPDVPSVEKWRVQMQHRIDYQWVWWALGGVGIAAICLTGRGKAGQITGIVTAAGGAAALVYAVWLQKEEIEANHPETRLENRAPGRAAPRR